MLFLFLKQKGLHIIFSPHLARCQSLGLLLCMGPSCFSLIERVLWKGLQWQIKSKTIISYRKSTQTWQQEINQEKLLKAIHITCQVISPESFRWVCGLLCQTGEGVLDSGCTDSVEEHCKHFIKTINMSSSTWYFIQNQKSISLQWKLIFE